MRRNIIYIAGLALICGAAMAQSTRSYTIVDTGQDRFFGDYSYITAPGNGDRFFGQDAQYAGLQPAYRDNGDGTVTDLNTSLMWQQTPDLDNQSTFRDAVSGASVFRLAGFDDWRLPTIKELYSLIDFTGSSQTRTPYIDTQYFDFRYGDESAGYRLIDAQYWTSTEYVGKTFNGNATVFGVNFADGRIKGYPRDRGAGGRTATHFVRYVRGNVEYGSNDFVDNGDGTVTDLATELMWQQADDGSTQNWEEALSYCESSSLATYADWRLPNAKELQSIVDYTQAPDAQDASRRGPAIDPVFDLSESESWFWTGTTLMETPSNRGSGTNAVYLTLGQAYGYVGGAWVNVHGAGAQRSDPKSGDPADWPHGHGPQGDQIRINNFVRCVRDASIAVGVEDQDLPDGYGLEPSYPNPFNSETTLAFTLPTVSEVELNIYDAAGRQIELLVDRRLPSGRHKFTWNGSNRSSGIYFYTLRTGSHFESGEMTLVR